MRQIKTRYFYPDELRESVAKRYLSGEMSYRELADEIGASSWSVRYWVQNLRETGSVNRRKTKSKTPDNRTAQEKFKLLLEVQGLPDSERGEFMRRQGLRDGDLERWQQEVLSSLSEPATVGSAKRVRELERKVTKTEKRLREAKALLELQKKVQALWGDEEDDTPTS